MKRIASPDRRAVVRSLAAMVLATIAAPAHGEGVVAHETPQGDRPPPPPRGGRSVMPLYDGPPVPPPFAQRPPKKRGPKKRRRHLEPKGSVPGNPGR